MTGLFSVQEKAAIKQTMIEANESILSNRTLSLSPRKGLNVYAFVIA